MAESNSQSRVVVVTGANKGIGFGIVKTLCKSHPDWIVYLTARNEENGRAAIEKLEKEGLSPRFHLLDIENNDTIVTLKDHLLKEHGGLDVLVNNAGFSFKRNSPEPFDKRVEVTININYLGTLNVCNVLFPILRPFARVVNVSSTASKMALSGCSKELQDFFINPVDLEGLNAKINDFVNDAKVEDYETKGWPKKAYAPYGVSKMGVNALTILQQKDFDKDERKDLIVNCCCPGYVNTDMTSGYGLKTIEDGADTPVFLACLPIEDPANPKGVFLRNRVIHDWKPQNMASLLLSFGAESTGSWISSWFK